MSRVATMQALEITSAVQSGGITNEQCLSSGLSRPITPMQAPPVTSVFNIQSGAATVSFPTEQCSGSGLSRPTTPMQTPPATSIQSGTTSV